jgi:hypothetical protein
MALKGSNTTKNYDLKGIKGFHKSTNILQN